MLTHTLPASTIVYLSCGTVICGSVSAHALQADMLCHQLLRLSIGADALMQSVEDLLREHVLMQLACMADALLHIVHVMSVTTQTSFTRVKSAQKLDSDSEWLLLKPAQCSPARRLRVTLLTTSTSCRMQR
jgi:hypothetical protein